MKIELNDWFVYAKYATFIFGGLGLLAGLSAFIINEKLKKESKTLIDDQKKELNAHKTEIKNQANKIKDLEESEGELKEQLKPENIERIQIEKQKELALNRMLNSPEEFDQNSGILFRYDYGPKHYADSRKMFIENFIDHVEVGKISAFVFRNFPDKVLEDEKVLDLMMNRALPNSFNIISRNLDAMNTAVLNKLDRSGGIESNEGLVKWYFRVLDSKDKIKQFLEKTRNEDERELAKQLLPKHIKVD